MRTYGTAKLVNGKWRIDAEPHVLIRLRRLFKRTGKSGDIRIEATDEICRDLLWFAQRYPLEFDPRDELEARAQSFDRRTETFEMLLTGKANPRPFNLAIPARDYQKVAAELALQSGGLLIADDMGAGKQQPVDAQVMTPDGYREIGSLKVGDLVTGSDGKPTRVTGVYPQGVKPSYRIRFSDGSSAEAGPDHLWTVCYRKGGKVMTRIVVTTEQIRTGSVVETRWPNGVLGKLSLGLLVKSHAAYIPMLSAPVEFSPSGSLPLPPYLLGQLIANGYLGGSGAVLTSGTVDWPHVKERIERDGVRLGAVRVSGGATAATIKGIRPIIKSLALDCCSHEKRIPALYARASVSDRVALLHGLMDGDGSCSATRNRVTYHSVNFGLAQDVRELVESLGGGATVRTYDRTHEGKPVEYQVRVRMPDGIPPFSLPRKADRYRPVKRKNPTRSIASVEYERDVESVCISVEAEDRLYATDHCILTHNTVTAIATLTEPDTRPALVVTLTSLPRQWQREIARFAPELRTTILKKGTPYELTPKRRAPAGQLSLLSPADEQPSLPDVIITNYHKLAGWSDVLAGKVRSIIFDEGHELRRCDSDKYKAAEKIARDCHYRVALTGTPVFNFGIEFFNIMEVLKPGALGTREEFIREWCGQASDQNKIPIKDTRAFGTYVRESGLMIRRTRADIARELPPLQRSVMHVETDEKALDKVSADVAELARIILEKESAWRERGEAARELDVKLRQATGIAKAPYVAEFVKMIVDSGEKAVVFAWHREVHSILSDKLKSCNPVFYTGEESAARKDENFRRFTSGDAQVLVMSLRAGAGLDGLQGHCRNVVFAELDWSPGVHAQCESRIHRDGQSDPVMVYYLVADEGADPIMLDVLGIKKEQVDGVRDPSAEILESAPVDAVKQLAAGYLRQRGLEVPGEF